MNGSSESDQPGTDQSDMSETSANKVRSTYRSIAACYDRLVKAFLLLGYRYDVYRARALEKANLEENDFVIDLGCGTGINFPGILARIGEHGRLVGIDITPEMLNQARKLVDSYGWKNVELIEADMDKCDFPEGADVILSTGAFGWLSDPDRVIRKSLGALKPGGRFVLLDLRKPARWPKILEVLFFDWIGAVAGVDSGYSNSQPWQSVEKHFEDSSYEEMYGGAMYLSVGNKKAASEAS